MVTKVGQIPNGYGSGMREHQDRILKLNEELSQQLRRSLEPMLGMASWSDEMARLTHEATSPLVAFQRQQAELLEKMRLAAEPMQIALVEQSHILQDRLLSLQASYQLSPFAQRTLYEATEWWRAGAEQVLSQVSRFRELIGTPFPSVLGSLRDEFTGFVVSTMTSVAAERGETRASALRASVALGAAELVQSSGSFVLPNPESGPSASQDEPGSLYLFSPQQQELVASGKDFEGTSAESVLSASPSARLQALAATAMRRYIGCIHITDVTGGTPLFRQTTEVLSAGVEVPLLFVGSQASLLALVRHLYVLLYESAGSDKLRYLKEHGGVLTTEDCGIIWSLKDLRNKWLIHDPAHGDATSVRKKKTDLLRTLRQLGLNRFPATEADFRLLHERLILGVDRFLAVLGGRLGLPDLDATCTPATDEAE